LLTKVILIIFTKFLVTNKTKLAIIPKKLYESEVDKQKNYKTIPVLKMKYLEKIVSKKAFINPVPSDSLNNITPITFDNQFIFDCGDKKYSLLQVINIIEAIEHKGSGSGFSQLSVYINDHTNKDTHIFSKKITKENLSNFWKEIKKGIFFLIKTIVYLIKNI
jgi:hypothetical protein